MKKIVLFVISSIALIITLGSSWAYDIPLNDTKVSNIIISQTTYISHGYQGLGDVDIYPNVSMISNDLITNYSNELWLQSVSFNRDVSILINDNLIVNGVRSVQIVHDFYMNWSSYRIYIYAFNSNNIMIHDSYVSSSVTWSFTYEIVENLYNQGYQAGHYDGYSQGKTDGYSEAEEYYAYYYDEQYITASQYGQIRYNEGYELGLTNEIDWFNWAFTFITMPVRILNVEVLPGIKIGYFALFTLMTGIVSWFFFIVGKGGRRK